MRVTSWLLSSVDTIFLDNYSQKSFTFKITACLNYTGIHVPESLNVLIKINTDPHFSRTTETHYSLETILKLNKSSCYDKNITVLFKNDWIYTEPIEFQLTYNLSESKECRGKSKTWCPLLDTQPSMMKHYVPFNQGCGDDNICQTKLSIHSNWVGGIETYIAGSSDPVEVVINIRNDEELAFKTKLLVEISVPLLNVPDVCQERNARSVECEIGNPFTGEVIFNNF